MLGIVPSKIRYWEKVIPQLKPHHQTGTSRRSYTPQDVELIKRIKFLRDEQNLPMDIVVSTLNADNKKVDKRLATIEILTQLREELVTIKNLV